MSNERLLDPRPGSPEAMAQGCTCPPQIGPDVVYDQNCPVHADSDRVASRPDGQVGSDGLEP